MADGDPTEDDVPPAWRYEPKPSGYARAPAKPRALGPGPRRQVLRVARADRRLDDARPDPQSPYITGRYQNQVASGAATEGIPWLLHVNQAGKRIEGLLVDLSGHEARFQRFGGDLKGGEFAIQTQPDPADGSGRIRVEGKDLVLDFKTPAGSLAAMRFQLRDNRPTFLDAALDSAIDVYEALGGKTPQARKTVQRTETTPLSSAQMLRLREAFAVERIEEYLRKYNDHASGIGSTEQFWRARAMSDLDEHVADELDPSRWPREQLDLARDYVRLLLAQNRSVLSGVRKSQLQWIEDATTTSMTGEKLSRDFPALRQLTGIPTPSAGLKQHVYEIEFKVKYKEPKLKATSKIKQLLKSVPVQVGAFTGTLSVLRTKPEQWNKPEVFKVVFGSLGILIGKGKVAGLEARGTATSYAEWTRADFAGYVKLLEGGAWAGKKVAGQEVGAAARDAALIIQGRGNHPELIVPIRDGLAAFREGAGVEFTASWGWIRDDDKRFEEIDFSRALEKAEYVLDKRAMNEVHFEFGSALLSGSGRQRIRMCAAEWLPWLASDKSTVKIVGHADTVDRPERNQELSEMRASNVRQALKDVLGERLRLSDDHFEVEGRGEAEAAMHDPDDTPDRKFRRVDVFLNGRCVLVLWRA